MMRGGSSESGGNEELLQRLVDNLMDSAEHPPSQVEGVSDEFIEQLERVPKKALREDMSCPICANPFLEGRLACSMGAREGSSFADIGQTLILLWCGCRAIRTICSIWSVSSLG